MKGPLPVTLLPLPWIALILVIVGAEVVKFQVVASVMPAKLLPFVSLNAPAAMCLKRAR